MSIQLSQRMSLRIKRPKCLCIALWPPLIRYLKDCNLEINLPIQMLRVLDAGNACHIFIRMGN